MHKISVLTAILAAGFLADVASARSGKTIRMFLPLEKITAGPYDNFQTAITADESALFFTRSQNLSSQVYKIDLKSGVTSPVTRSEVDAKSPTVNAEGSKLAVTYFGFDAKGDICLVDNESKTNCITGPGLGEHSPFFIDNETLGYVQSDDLGSIHRVLAYNLKSGSRTELAAGQIFGPAISPTKKLLAYKSAGPDFIIFDLEKKSQIRKISIDLPGTSGFAKFSADGNYLYFAQYILDSNRDLVLDSRDAAAVFRIKINDKDPFPEQLTSLDQNCSYPTPSSSGVYVTCAFEGALDVYKVALTGITPKDWTTAELWEAHRAARSYSDKIILLNQVMARKTGFSRQELEERLLHNFIFMHAWLPALRYAKNLRNLSSDYIPLAILLDTLTKWDALPSKENVSELARILDAAETDLEKLNDTPLKKIVKAHIEFFRNRKTIALEMVIAASPNTPMGLYWQTRLIEKIHEDQPSDAYQRALSDRIVSNISSEETRFYYLNRFFQKMESSKSREQSLQDLERQLKAATDPVTIGLREIVQNEQQMYRVLATEDKTIVRTEMRQIVDRVKRLKDSYFALRLLFTRAIFLLQKNDRPKELSQMMSLWLSYVDPTSKEYTYAIDALRSTSLEAAYKFYNGPEATKELAKGSFYSSIRTTDDLESHYQYALLSSSKESWTELLKIYDTMIKDGLIDPDSLSFVKAVNRVLGSGNRATDDGLREATTSMEKISDNLIGIGVKHLFLGYLYHEQFNRSAKDFEVDHDMAQRAHRSYLFAIDAAFENDRIQASALQNLGLLHLQLKNYAMASEFFSKRRLLEFSSSDQREALAWFESKSLYQSYRVNEALALIDEVIHDVRTNRLAFLEKQAFYSWNAGQYEKSSLIYESLIPALGEKATSSIYLSYGYSLMKSLKIDAAEVAFNKAIELTKSESTRTVHGIRRSPEKIRFTALGLLARLDLSRDKRVNYLNQRLKMFDVMISRAKTYYLDSATLMSQLVKEQFDLALFELDSKTEGSTAALEKTLNLAQAFGEEYGFLNQTVFNTLKNGMLILLNRPHCRTEAMIRKIDLIAGKTSKDFDAEKMPSNQLRKQWAEIGLVQLAYQLDKKPDSSKRFAEESDKLLMEGSIAELAKERQDLIAALKEYRDRLAEIL